MNVYKQHTQIGFTLVELVVVIAVISILSATAMPRFVAKETFNTRGDAGAFVSAMRYAQKTAVAQHRPVYCLVNTATRNVRVCYDNTCASGVIDPVTSAGFNHTLSDSVVLSASDQTTIGFDKLGRPISSAASLLTGNQVFTVQNAIQASQAITITVVAETGYTYAS